MIKASELRIGNWLYKDLSIDDIELRQVLPGDIIYIAIEEENGEDFMSYQSVALTEHWLFKFGFEKVVYDDDQHGYGTEYHLKVNSDIFLNYDEDFSVGIFGSKELMKDEIGVIPNWRTIKTVHGLQNLYFALTGEELEIKK